MSFLTKLLFLIVFVEIIFLVAILLHPNTAGFIEQITTASAPPPPPLPPTPSYIKQFSVVSVPQGGMRLMEFSVADEIEEVVCQGKKVKYSYRDGVVRFIVSASYDDIKGYTCSMDGEQILRVAVTEGKFDKKVHTLIVGNSFVQPSVKERGRAAVDRAVLDTVYNQSSADFVGVDIFNPYKHIEPISHFGEYRVFQNGAAARHNGTDYLTDTGEPLYAIGSGTVRMVRDLFYCGKTIIVDHGFDIFSVYCHMDSFEIEEGTMVSAGDIVGLAGNTGLSTEPHLHLGIKHREDWIDLIQFVNQIPIISKVSDS